MNQEHVSTGERSSEVWDPASGTWTTMAPADAPRVYHSTAVLMPDGRVPVAGAGAVDGPNSPGEPTAQYYSPAVPVQGRTPDDHQRAVDRVVRLDDQRRHARRGVDHVGGARFARRRHTHTLDMNQHFVPLSFTRVSGSVRLDVPNAPNTVPPGYYMLFLLNDEGVPAVAPYIQIGRQSTPPPTVSITAPTAGQVSGGVNLAADASDAAGIRDVQFTVYGQAVDGEPPDTTSPFTATWDSTAVSNGSHTIVVTATKTAGSTPTLRRSA